MRVLFTTLPYSGHVHPLVPFARALADAGHDVAFAARAAFAPTSSTPSSWPPTAITWCGTPPRSPATAARRS